MELDIHEKQHRQRFDEVEEWKQFDDKRVRGPAYLYQPEQRWVKQEAEESNTPEKVQACLVFPTGKC